MPIRSWGSCAGSSGCETSSLCLGLTFRFSTTLRTMRSASGSSLAKWSATPDSLVCRSAPPRSSAETSSPVADLTSGGPARNMVPLPLTMIDSSDIAGM